MQTKMCDYCSSNPAVVRNWWSKYFHVYSGVAKFCSQHCEEAFYAELEESPDVSYS